MSSNLHFVHLTFLFSVYKWDLVVQSIPSILCRYWYLHWLFVRLANVPFSEGMVVGWAVTLLFCGFAVFLFCHFIGLVYLVAVALPLVPNGFGLCVRAGFGAQSFNLLLKFIRSTKFQVCTSARLMQNPC